LKRVEKVMSLREREILTVVCESGFFRKYKKHKMTQEQKNSTKRREELQWFVLLFHRAPKMDKKKEEHKHRR
jgi:hypothetical protein